MLNNSGMENKDENKNNKQGISALVEETNNNNNNETNIKKE